jgi:hypothetical protein
LLTDQISSLTTSSSQETQGLPHLSPPPRKIRRMQIGFGGTAYGNSSEAAATYGSSLSSIKSVGQRLKDASRGNKDAANIGGTAVNLNGSCLTSKGILPQKEQLQRNLRVPLVLTELQKNTVRVIGQYLRELGMHDTVDSLVEETGCRIENPLSMKLRESIQHAHWQKALDLIEKIRLHLTDKQYFAVRVILLEEKFKELVARGEVFFKFMIDFRSVLTIIFIFKAFICPSCTSN